MKLRLTKYNLTPAQRNAILGCAANGWVKAHENTRWALYSKGLIGAHMKLTEEGQQVRRELLHRARGKELG